MGNNSKPLEEAKSFVAIVGGPDHESEKKNTVKFDEDSSLDEHGRTFIRNVYVEKHVLQKIGWSQGQRLKVTVELG